MTNVNSFPEKGGTKVRLFQAAEAALRKQGWEVERIPGAGKASVRQIRKAGQTKTVSIRTTQDRWIAFPRTQDDRGWVTLGDVDFVVAASVDDPDRPEYALIHMIPGDDARSRFDRAYKARIDAGHTIPVGRGVWISLYEHESSNPVSLVGAGAGLAYPEIDRVPLADSADRPRPAVVSAPSVAAQPSAGALGPIPAARKWLAEQLGVAEADVKITVSY